MTRSLRSFAWLSALLLVASSAAGQTCISLTTLGGAVTQNFDTLANTGTTNNLVISGWYLTESGGGARDNEQYGADTGGSGTGDTYSYGTLSTTERALGGLQSGTLIPTFGACFTNDTGATITSLAFDYWGEEWRLGTASRTDQLDFQYSLDATSLGTGTWTDHNALDFVTPNTSTAGAKDGNAVGNRTQKTSTMPCLSLPVGTSFWIRWNDFNASGADDGLAVDDFSLTPSAPADVCLSIDDVTVMEGESGTTIAQFTVSLAQPAGGGGVSFNIATQDSTATVADNDYVLNSLTGQSISSGNSTYFFDVTVNGDTNPESYESFLVNVTNVSGAFVKDSQGVGTIQTDDATITGIHAVQGTGTSSPILGQTVAVEGVVTRSFQTQGADQLRGFFLQEEDVETDSDPLTSEGLFVFCSSCPTAVSEGERVRATGSVSEFNGMTQITASLAPAVVVIESGNHLADLTATAIDLPVPGSFANIDLFYEPLEGMLVTFSDTLTVSEYFELFRYGQVELFQGGRPRQFTEDNAPNATNFADHLDDLDRRRVILDDDDNVQNAPLSLAETFQYVYHPTANGGFSAGTQGTDFFRGADTVAGLTGVLHWSWAGQTGTDAWRIRPTVANPTSFTVVNPRPAAPVVGGSIKAVSMNLLNYFTTLDTGSSVCGPSANQGCRGADSAAELARQRDRAALVICTLNADVYGFSELENTTATTAVNDLLTAVNALCGGSDPYAFASTGGTLGTDAIRVAIVYRSATLSAVGSPQVDSDPIHNRPPTAQTFDVIEPGNPALGERFTVIANHFKSKGCGGAVGSDLDQLDGQGCFNATRDAQAARLLTWITGTVLPAAGDADVLLLGDFNSYAKEDPVTTLAGGGYVDLMSALLGTAGYSYLFDGQVGHLDYAFASSAFASGVAGISPWHINADEVPLFDYSDEVKDPGEATFEEKPDGSALAPPRTVFAASSPYRAADHDPVLVGLYASADLSITKTDAPDPVTAGQTLTYTITVFNDGPDAAQAEWSDTLPAGTTFLSLIAPAGWSCQNPGVGNGGNVSCARASLGVGNASFTLEVLVSAGVSSGTILSNTANLTSGAIETGPGDESGTASTAVATSADLSVTKSDDADPVAPGAQIVYTITVTNAGPSLAAGASLTDVLPTGTTFVSLGAPDGWDCTTPTAGTNGTVSCTRNAALQLGDAVFTLTVEVSGAVTSGTVITNDAVVSATTPDPDSTDTTGTASTTVVAPVMEPAALVVDPSGNGVLEPEETVSVEPAWVNNGTAAAASVTGGTANFTGPAGPSYQIDDAVAAYGTVNVGAQASCATGADCYLVTISPGPRPVTHWDAAIDETLSTGESKTWMLHVGESFPDAVPGVFHYESIERALHHGIAAGCGGGNYCPADGVTRAQLALLLVRAVGVPSPAACVDGNEVFADVDDANQFCPFIEEAADLTRQITAGCGGGNYCPDQIVTRQEAARFVLRALHTPGYAPPACAELDPPPYADVPWDHPYCGWILELKNAGYAESCDDGTNYCPLGPVDRAPLAGLLSRAFGLNLYVP